ncbi:ABC transporter permease [Thermoactinomyces daqus]|jgi:ABC-2 type transport system permease protein|uniref:ABC transporter permease n=1 Tax=Thermoactinomyces daqus TaxID=1329516 RepID=A0A7W1X7B0_9BACL|nr:MULTISPECIES: ABC transporter permease [Thermoactinomyces]MBA4541398.1 ABC transporter permease [Thermoactinomyces daqus]MBH8603630.1 ABC transporter permease [Thermoactinomyces sp. CICC 10522]
MNLDSTALFYQRMQQSWLKAIGIIRLVAGGGGTPLFAGVVLIGLYFGYKRFLEWMPSSFPAGLLTGLVLSLLLTSSRIRTWIKPADPVFLLPAETKMNGYFRASLCYSSLVHIIHLALALLLLSPLLAAGAPEDRSPLWLLFALLSLAQILNVLIEWQSMRLLCKWSRRKIRGIAFLRFLLNFLWTEASMDRQWVGLLVLFCIMAGVWLGQVAVTPAFPLPWDELKKQEQRLLARYYHWAGWFVDLPAVQQPIRRRHIWVRIADRFTNYRKNPLLYLYWRHFFRKSELYAVFFRLLLWAIIMMALFPNPWVIFGIYLAASLMLFSQLPALIDANSYPAALKLYPLPKAAFKNSLARIGTVLSGMQALILTMVIAGFHWLSFAGTLLFLAYGLILSMIMAGLKKRSVPPQK